MEPDSKKRRGRPTAFPPSYIAELTEYYRRLGKPHERRTIVNKAYMLRALGVLFNLVDDLPMLSYLLDKQAGKLHESLMTRLGRIDDEEEMVETAIAVSFFQGDKDCDFDEMRNAWEVLTHVAKAKTLPQSTSSGTAGNMT